MKETRTITFVIRRTHHFCIHALTTDKTMTVQDNLTCPFHGPENRAVKWGWHGQAIEPGQIPQAKLPIRKQVNLEAMTF